MLLSNLLQYKKKRPGRPGGYRGPEEPFLSFLAVKSLGSLQAKWTTVLGSGDIPYVVLGLHRVLKGAKSSTARMSRFQMRFYVRCDDSISGVTSGTKFYRILSKH